VVNDIGCFKDWASLIFAIRSNFDGDILAIQVDFFVEIGKGCFRIKLVIQLCWWICRFFHLFFALFHFKLTFFELLFNHYCILFLRWINLIFSNILFIGYPFLDSFFWLLQLLSFLLELLHENLKLINGIALKI